MDRRRLLKTAAIGAAASTLAAPAIAQALPELKWRLTSSFPKSLDTLFGGAESFAKRVAQLSDNKFQIRVFAPGEVVPALQALDAVQNGTVEMCHTASYYFVGKDLTFGFDAGVPFGLTARQQHAWITQGGGAQLMRDFMAEYNVVTMPAGNTGVQMGGWFRKELKTLDDVKGLKMRIPGIGGQVWSKLGAVPQQIAGGEIYPSLERGAIDGAEWVGPHDDEKLGFHKVAPFYYYPGFWEAGTQISLMVNKGLWDGLPPIYRGMIEVAAAETNGDMMARYDHQNPQALRRLVAAGAQLRPYPREILAAAWKATHELYDEISGKNPKFKAVYEPWRKFRDDQYLWFRVAELTYENFAFTAAQTVR
ncbi:MAG: ABC transporter substrate-binding protein [Alphaproteobacteria bacterium]|nr:ABC transporter substrate-binding protein [Alphaproteobacteria bacterium]